MPADMRWEKKCNFYVANECVDKFRKEAVKFLRLSPDEAYNTHFGVRSLLNFDLKDDGRFISSVKFTLQDLSKVIDLFTAMVIFKNVSILSLMLQFIDLFHLFW